MGKKSVLVTKQRVFSELVTPPTSLLPLRENRDTRMEEGYGSGFVSFTFATLLIFLIFLVCFPYRNPLPFYVNFLCCLFQSRLD